MITAERTKYWCIPRIRNLELLHASYITHSFARHTHEGYGIGVIEEGALGFTYHGENLVAPAGTINLVNPGEPHNGFAAVASGWTYRMFYFDASLIGRALSEMADRPMDIPYFRPGVIRDPCLADMIRNLHLEFERDGVPLLRRESGFLRMLARLISGHGEKIPEHRHVGNEPGAVTRAREYIESHFHADISIEDLSRVADLSRFHLIRVFTNEMGLPPHAYLTQVRINHAKKRLAQGAPIAEVALDTGFTDQSHLTRHFKRITGLTPGRYSNFVQDG
jgi:AraC-like DNA-binding protein